MDAAIWSAGTIGSSPQDLKLLQALIGKHLHEVLCGSEESIKHLGYVF